jgi:hypothetical protein
MIGVCRMYSLIEHQDNLFDEIEEKNIGNFPFKSWAMMSMFLLFFLHHNKPNTYYYLEKSEKSHKNNKVWKTRTHKTTCSEEYLTYSEQDGRIEKIFRE